MATTLCVYNNSCTLIQMIGLPVMPPYWALGFQLCRYGYNTVWCGINRRCTLIQMIGLPVMPPYWSFSCVAMATTLCGVVLTDVVP